MSSVIKTSIHDVNNTSTYEKNSYFVKPSSFNEDVIQFSWWKNKMYSYIKLKYKSLNQVNPPLKKHQKKNQVFFFKNTKTKLIGQF